MYFVLFCFVLAFTAMSQLMLGEKGLLCNMTLPDRHELLTEPFLAILHISVLPTWNLLMPFSDMTAMLGVSNLIAQSLKQQPLKLRWP